MYKCHWIIGWTRFQIYWITIGSILRWLYVFASCLCPFWLWSVRSWKFAVLELRSSCIEMHREFISICFTRLSARHCSLHSSPRKCSSILTSLYHLRLWTAPAVRTPCVLSGTSIKGNGFSLLVSFQQDMVLQWTNTHNLVVIVKPLW